MSDPLVHAFFVGRAFAEAIGEQFEATVSNALSELGKFDAEQRERLRAFSEQVAERAAREEALTLQRQAVVMTDEAASQPEDLQELIDELRAEIAQLRSELQTYRSRSV